MTKTSLTVTYSTFNTKLYTNKNIDIFYSAHNTFLE